MLFKYIGGGFNDGQKNYEAGDIVKSDLNLCDIFKNAFEPLNQVSVEAENDEIKIHENVTEEVSPEKGVQVTNVEPEKPKRIIRKRKNA